MQLGQPELSLKVKDLRASIAFYEALGFNAVEGAVDEGWQVMARDRLRIGLYAEGVKTNSLTFFGGEVGALCEALARHGITPRSGPEKEADGSIGATLQDPDGNVIYLNGR